jgi:2-polyprenyl-6-methoxyphenol hydroxylase-like FAD-dependent oxidoreductase
VDIAIAGGGIGGLTAAIALQQLGFDADVYEAAPALEATGAGILVPPNAMAALARLGLDDAVAARGVAIEAMEIADHSGTLQVVDGVRIAAQTGFPMIAIRRAVLQQLLVNAVEAGTLHLGRALARYECAADAIALTFDDATRATARLLIGADGLRSAVRRQVRPRAALRYSGQTCFRGLAMLPAERDIAPRANEVWGGALRFGYAPVAPGIVYWYAPMTSPPDTCSLPAHGGWLAERYAAFPAPVRSLIEATPETSILQTDLYDLAPMRGWSNGQVVLIGDAAHAATPNLGQGGAQAIEDAVVLAAVLKSMGPIPEALAEFERRRRSRTHRVVTRSRLLGQMAHWQRPMLCRLRNTVLRMTPARVRQREIESLFSAPF